MTEYSDNLTKADVEAVLEALPGHAIRAQMQARQEDARAALGQEGDA